MGQHLPRAHPHGGGRASPFAIFQLYSFMEDLSDAVALDRASSIIQFRPVALPLSHSALVTTTIISGIFVLNNLLVVRIL